MQERAYSTYCSLKCSSIQGYLFQESYFTYGVAYLSWVDKRTGTHDVRNAMHTIMGVNLWESLTNTCKK